MRTWKWIVLGMLWSAPAANAALVEALAQPYAAPQIVGVDGWINSPPLSIKSLKGKVVLVDFWTYSCVNCVRTLPYLTAWDKKYRDKGLVIIGVHSPEFDFEKQQGNVEAAVKKRGIQYPVALDSGLKTWNSFHNRYWPAQYLIDKEGRVVYTHFGEGADEATEHNIQELLGASGEVTKSTAPAWSVQQTPETYLGTKRGARYEGEPLKPEATSYHFPPALSQHHWALNGGWQAGAESIGAVQAGASLRINFVARNVYLVMGTKDGKPQKVDLTLNGKAIAPVQVGQHTIYELAALESVQPGTLDISASRPGLEVFAFTFGS